MSISRDQVPAPTMEIEPRDLAHNFLLFLLFRGGRLYFKRNEDFRRDYQVFPYEARPRGTAPPFPMSRIEVALIRESQGQV